MSNSVDIGRMVAEGFDKYTHEEILVAAGLRNQPEVGGSFLRQILNYQNLSFLIKEAIHYKNLRMAIIALNLKNSEMRSEQGESNYGSI